MKKKTIIIIAAVAVAVAALIWFLKWRKKNTINGVIGTMDFITKKEAREKLRIAAEIVQANYKQGGADTVECVDFLVKENGYTKAMAFICIATENLENNKTFDTSVGDMIFATLANM